MAGHMVNHYTKFADPIRLSILELWVLTSPVGYHWQERAGHLEAIFQGEGVVPLPIYWYHSKCNWMRYNFAADSFYIMKLCSRLFVLYCRSRPKDDKSRHFDAHFEEVRGSVEPRWMARWKARVEFLLSVIELLFLCITVEALQCKMCQNSLPSGVGRPVWTKISGGRGRPWGIFFGFYKTRHFAIGQCKLHCATCSRFDTILAGDIQTNGQTDGIAAASTAHAIKHCGVL